MFTVGVVNNNQALAHRSGCHRWHSCPSDSGSYVCGDLGYYSECGTTSTPTYSFVAPQTPVKTTAEEIKETSIQYKTVKKNNYNQYSGYKKIITPGKPGLQSSKIIINYIDGVENSRNAPIITVVQPPVDEVIEVGVRTKPIARFTKIRDMEGGFMNMNKGKYIVEGLYVPNEKVTLYQNDKKVGTTSTNKDGYFEFHQLRKGDKPSWLVLYDKKGTKGKQLSEKTKATFTLKLLQTEYSLINKK